MCLIILDIFFILFSSLGTQNRTLGCVREYNHAQVSDKRCGQKPASAIRSCGGSCQPRWITSQWGPCSATCGPATQNRQIQCRQDISHQALNAKVSIFNPTNFHC